MFTHGCAGSSSMQCKTGKVAEYSEPDFVADFRGYERKFLAFQQVKKRVVREFDQCAD